MNERIKEYNVSRKFISLHFFWAILIFILAIMNFSNPFGISFFIIGIIFLGLLYFFKNNRVFNQKKA